MEQSKKTNFVLAALFILAGVFLRLIPHAPNFAPISAIAIFSGAHLSKKWGVVIAVLAMAISDFFIGFYDIKIMASVYLSFLLSVFLGALIKNKKTFKDVALISLASSISFFIITNLAVFVFSPWYEKTFSGLLYCYFMALPFFKNTLLSDIFYTFSFFGLYELSLKAFQKHASIKKRFCYICDRW